MLMVAISNRMGSSCAILVAARCGGRSARRLAALGGAFLVCAAAACAPSAPPEAPDAAAASGRSEASSDEVWGASPPAADAPAPLEPEAARASTDASGATSSASSGDDGLDADIAELSASTQAASSERSAAGDAKPATTAESTTGREIVYRVTPKGLVIEVDGIHLRPEAVPFKQKSGAYGIQLVVNAESFDGRKYWLNKPKQGPLSIAGKIEGQGKSARFVDQREAGGEEPVLDGSPRRFEQRWPGPGQPKLWAGQTVTLEVGLWGVRVDSERERPVRRLFVVKLVAGPRSRPVITPPTLDWGT